MQPGGRWEDPRGDGQGLDGLLWWDEWERAHWRTVAGAELSGHGEGRNKPEVLQTLDPGKTEGH